MSVPTGSEALTKARKEEIVNACAALYKTMGFREITLDAIGKRTSFTRTSIYNYFHTKEEIFLALLQREHEAWIADMRGIFAEPAMPASAFAEAFAHALEGRGCMLKLMSMNLYELEGNSRMENLVAFKRVYAQAMQTIAQGLAKFFPQMGKSGVDAFLYAFFPFLFGIYPYTAATGKQRAAMDLAGMRYTPRTVFEITRALVEKLLPAQG